MAGPAAAPGDPPPLDVNLLGDQPLLPTQLDFIQSPAAKKVYIGPIGSGKTEVACRQAIVLSHQFAPNFGMIGRQTYPELRDTTRKRFLEVANPALIRAASLPNNGGGWVEWNCGGATIFRHLDVLNDLEFGSLDLGYCGLDEITESTEHAFNMLEGRCGRHWKAAGIAPADFPYSPIFGGGNPAGWDWVYRLFFKPGHDPMFKGFRPRPRENEPNLPPGYYANLARGKADWWIRRFLQGDMRMLQGLVWPQFDEHVNIVKPFPLPVHWTRVMGLDHGRNNPTAAQWWAVDPDGNLICYRDYEVAGPTAAEHAKVLLARDRGEVIERRVADPSIFAKNQSVGGKWHSIAEEYAQNGLELEPGDNAMQASLERCGLLLWADPLRKFPDWHPKRGRPGAPRAFFFTTCERSIEEVSSWQFKQFRDQALGLREEPVDRDDHLCDTFRYVATSFAEPAVEPRPVRQPTHDEWRVERQQALHREVMRRYRERQQQQGDSYV